MRARFGAGSVGFNILTKKDADGQIADLVPGAWSERAADAVDLTADGCVGVVDMQTASLCGG